MTVKIKSNDRIMLSLPREFKIKFKQEAAIKGLTMTEYARQLAKEGEDISKLLRWDYKKKAQAGENLVLMLVFMFVMAIVGIIGFKVIGAMNTEIQNDLSFTDTAKFTSDELTNNYPSLLDSLFVFAFVMLWIFIIISSYFLDSHPIFFVIVFIASIIITIIAGTVSNFYEEFTADSAIATEADSFPMTNFLLGKLPFVVVVVVLSAALAIYGKNKSLS